MSSTNTIFQHSLYVGNNFNAILYGVELVFYFATLSIISRSNRQEKAAKQSNIRLSVLSTVLISMITIFVIVQAIFGEQMWITNEDYPGGTAAYFANHAAVWYETLGTTASVVLSLTSDGFLIYRTYIVWNNWRAILFPSVLYFASAVLGIMTCYYSGKPDSDFFVGLAVNIALSWSSVVIGLNFTCTTLICGRILWVAKRMEGTLGRKASKKYTGAASLIIESMLPYTLFGIMYIVTLGINHPTSVVFLSLYIMFMCLSSQMLILRVLMNRAWTRDAVTMGVNSARCVEP
ncbi:hypothetical protein C8Q80DRAFT_1221876 [Daedaleopsis nitida]|nr:hypothetical protein C8Q80DRAFT_1221876 [Daedaleopsis nitida]